MTSEEHTQEVTHSRRDLESACTIYRVQQTSTHTMYTKNGMKHRIDGPAMIAGDKEWFYVNGYLKTPEEHASIKALNTTYSTTLSNEEFAYTQAMCRPTGIYTVSASE